MAKLVKTLVFQLKLPISETLNDAHSGIKCFLVYHLHQCGSPWHGQGLQTNLCCMGVICKKRKQLQVGPRAKKPSFFKSEQQNCCFGQLCALIAHHRCLITWHLRVSKHLPWDRLLEFSIKAFWSLMIQDLGPSKNGQISENSDFEVDISQIGNFRGF